MSEHIEPTPGDLVRCHARNFGMGVYTHVQITAGGEPVTYGAVIGLRSKFGYVSLDVEYVGHTARIIEVIGRVPEGVEVSSYSRELRAFLQDKS